MFAVVAAASSCGLLLGAGAIVDVAHLSGPPRAPALAAAAEKGSVSIAICTGSSCESRCNFNAVRTFEGLAEDSEVDLVEINCMNMCKRGPAVRLTVDDAVATVEGRMNELETKRTAFQNVASVARVEAVYGVAQAIADGSLRDSYGDFAVTPHGPLPPSAM